MSAESLLLRKKRMRELEKMWAAVVDQEGAAESKSADAESADVTADTARQQKEEESKLKEKEKERQQQLLAMEQERERQRAQWLHKTVKPRKTSVALSLALSSGPRGFGLGLSGQSSSCLHVNSGYLDVGDDSLFSAPPTAVAATTTTGSTCPAWLRQHVADICKDSLGNSGPVSVAASDPSVPLAAPVPASAAVPANANSAPLSTPTVVGADS